MLEQITVSNFRSIRRADLTLNSSGLTILIGANGTGKSNVIRALDFFGSIARRGLASAVRSVGGARGIQPKPAPARRDSTSFVTPQFEARLGSPIPRGYPGEVLKPEVHYALRLNRSDVTDYVVSSERVRFQQPLAFAHFDALARGDQLKAAFRLDSSFLELSRGRVGPYEWTSEPSLTSTASIALWLAWFGFYDLEKTFTQPAEVEFPKFLRWIVTEHASALNEARLAATTALDPNPPQPLSWANQLRSTARLIANTARFELHIDKLRSTQRDVLDGLAADGSGLPSAVGQLAEEDRSQITRTLRIIAPHLTRFSVNRLQDGSEFVAFREWDSVRKMESWNSSDGSLRALAIMVAAHSARQGSLLLIEEPEQGLHPWAVGPLVEHLRDVASERKLAIVLSSHSPQVLDSVDSDAVRLVERRRETGTTVVPLSSVVPDKLSRGEIGRMWAKGLLGAIPKE